MQHAFRLSLTIMIEMRWISILIIINGDGLYRFPNNSSWNPFKVQWFVSSIMWSHIYSPRKHSCKFFWKATPGTLEIGYVTWPKWERCNTKLNLFQYTRMDKAQINWLREEAIQDGSIPTKFRVLLFRRFLNHFIIRQIKNWFDANPDLWKPY